jgi:hypothetical protein
VHKAGGATEYGQTEPSGFRSAVHGGPPGRAKSSKVILPQVLLCADGMSCPLWGGDRDVHKGATVITTSKDFWLRPLKGLR